MQIAILAGGLATRLGPLTERVPKSMVAVHARPFIDYQIELLKRHGVSDVVLCVGHLAGPLRAHVADGARYGVRVRYSDEGGRRLGTAGALKWAEPLLDDAFFVMFGDSYLGFDYGAIMARFRAGTWPALMVVYRNEDRYDASDVIVRDGLVLAYGRDQRSPEMVYINSGLSVLARTTLAELPPGRSASLQEFYRAIIARRDLAALETSQRFYEIGSPSGLTEFERLVAEGGLPA